MTNSERSPRIIGARQAYEYLMKMYGREFTTRIPWGTFKKECELGNIPYVWQRRPGCTREYSQSTLVDWFQNQFPDHAPHSLT